MWSRRKEVCPDGRCLESRVRREISEYRGSKHQFSQAARITLRNQSRLVQVRISGS